MRSLRDRSLRRALQVKPGVVRSFAMPSDVQRHQIAEHLRYEIAMLWACGTEIRRGGYPWAASNSLVESFALHARNVVDFFFTEPVGDDVVARHFFRDETAWAGIRTAIPATLATAKKRANKEVSHLTYSRLAVSPNDKPWPVEEIVREVDTVLRIFCERADLLPDGVKLLRYKELLP